MVSSRTIKFIDENINDNCRLKRKSNIMNTKIEKPQIVLNDNLTQKEIESWKCVDCVKCDEIFLTTGDEDTCYDCEQGFNDSKNEDKSESA